MFNPEKVIKRTKGRMVMLYAVVEGEETHMASFFHEEKAKYVLEALEEHHEVPTVDEDAKPKKKKTSAKSGKKK